tara:strand:- start:130 stop:453 length:324 start_codon:yes stop_codon:yes gene_type:complete
MKTLETIPNSNTSNEEKLFIERVAQKIYNSGFVTPAIFFLEMTKPLALLGSHFLIFLGPVINAFIQSDKYYRSAQVFEEPKNIEKLLQAIEKLEFDSKKLKGVPSER